MKRKISKLLLIEPLFHLLFIIISVIKLHLQHVCDDIDAL
jgi:hypothetical protein